MTLRTPRTGCPETRPAGCPSGAASEPDGAGHQVDDLTGDVHRLVGVALVVAAEQGQVEPELGRQDPGDGQHHGQRQPDALGEQTDENGRAQSSGSYLVRLSAGATVVTEKAIVPAGSGSVGFSGSVPESPHAGTPKATAASRMASTEAGVF